MIDQTIREAADLVDRIPVKDAFNWKRLKRHGWAVLPGVLDDEQCRDLAAVYDEEGPFRSHIIMARHGFGQGEYRYFAYPLPALIQELRERLYARLVCVANSWCCRLTPGATRSHGGSGSRRALIPGSIS